MNKRDMLLTWTVLTHLASPWPRHCESSHGASSSSPPPQLPYSKSRTWPEWRRLRNLQKQTGIVSSILLAMLQKKVLGQLFDRDTDRCRQPSPTWAVIQVFCLTRKESFHQGNWDSSSLMNFEVKGLCLFPLFCLCSADNWSHFQ